MQISILREDNEAVITVSVPGDPRSPYIARDDHPNFKAMVAAAVSGDTYELPALFDVAEAIAVKFQRLSERVTVQDGQIKFDGVVVDGTLSQQILDAVQEGGDDTTYKSLVAFMEKVYTNPDGPTATRIYDWFRAQDGLTITPEGNIVGYKYVRVDPTYGYRSVASGREPVLVTFPDGRAETFTGSIPNPVGGVVEMPRNLVNSDAEQTCSVGLHVGAWNYVQHQGTILEIHVNPRDVVSVPTDYNGEKVRVCRYTVVGPISEKYGQAVKQSSDDAPRERGTTDAPTTREDLDLALAPLRALQAPAELVEGLRLIDQDGDEGTVVPSEYAESGFAIQYDNSVYGNVDLYNDDVSFDGSFDGEDTDRMCMFRPVKEVVDVEYGVGDRVAVTDGLSGARTHGRGGATSQAAKGNGLNPAQDPRTGRFENGRPGSQRDASTGRFV